MDGNCLIPAVQRLCIQCKDQSYNYSLKSHALELLKQLQSRIPDIDISKGNYQPINGVNHMSLREDDDLDDGEDGPVVIPIDEINASLERSSTIGQSKIRLGDIDRVKSMYASKYPFLFASMMDDEDIIMTCARILDEKPDVTSVREAAAYLEEVENSSNQL